MGPRARRGRRPASVADALVGVRKRPRVAIGASRVLVVVLREEGLFGRWVVEGSECDQPRVYA
jgi:hypothetical protein